MWIPHSCPISLGFRKSWASGLGQMHGHIDMLVASDEYGSTLLHEALWMQIRNGSKMYLDDTEMIPHSLSVFHVQLS